MEGSEGDGPASAVDAVDQAGEGGDAVETGETGEGEVLLKVSKAWLGKVSGRCRGGREPL